MKRFLTLALALIPLLAFAQDDYYFVPSKKKAKTEVVKRATVTPVERATQVNYNSCNRSDDEYNRRYSFSGDLQNAGGAFSDNDTTLVARVDTVYVSDYDVNDPEQDYRYSRRLLRFHSPSYYYYRSPYYWDIVYGYGAWDYIYDPFYDPWYWHYGWGYGWSWGPWDCWYGGIWGYHHPYHWAYWGWGPGWSYIGGIGGHNINVNTSRYNYRPRGEYVRTNSGSRFGERVRTNPSLLSRQRTSGGRTNGVYAQDSRTGARSGSSVRSTGARGTSAQNSAGYRGSYSDYASRRANAGLTRTTSGDRVSSSRSANSRFGERGSAPVVINRDGSRVSSSRSSAASNRSYSNSQSSSRASSTTTYSSPTYSSGSSVRSSGGSYSGGGGSYSGGGGGSRGGGGGGRR